MSFVAERQFIIATRETGYRTTSSAIAELVDNALQAGARRIEIRTRHFERNATEEPGVSVLDDGAGMDPRLLTLALRFGGTERFDDRAGLGRFGMGLPNSSVSQARRVDVYSWRSPKRVFHTYFDVDEIAAGTLTDVPDASPATLPAWITEKLPKSGTAVVWSKCDRLSARRIDTFRERIAADLGRSFRYFLADGVRLMIDGSNVRLIDPLFCRQRADLEGQATEVGQPLVYEVASPRDAGIVSTIRVRFSFLPLRRWSELPVDDKRRVGISKGAGVSVVRAGREIAYGWFFMGQKRKENYDDWWRCEIQFEPELDELFGVTHSKQGVRPSTELETILSRDLEAIAHDLNRRVRQEFTGLKSGGAKSATKLANTKDRFLAPLKKGMPLATSNGHGVNYRISTRAMQQRRFFSSAVSRGRVSLTINKNHPFFGVYAAPAKNGSGADARFAIDCLLLAIARAEHGAKTQAQRDTIRNCFDTWSNNLAAFLRK